MSIRISPILAGSTLTFVLCIVALKLNLRGPLWAAVGLVLGRFIYELFIKPYVNFFPGR